MQLIYVKHFNSRDNLDTEKLLDDSGQDSSGEMIPSSDFQIRNRYLSRIGAPVNINDVSYLASEFSWYFCQSYLFNQTTSFIV